MYPWSRSDVSISQHFEVLFGVSLAAMAWQVLGLQMEEAASRYGG
jgi:hypothetical protein